jgi:hypothetical protein
MASDIYQGISRHVIDTHSIPSFIESNGIVWCGEHHQYPTPGCLWMCPTPGCLWTRRDGVSGAGAAEAVADVDGSAAWERRSIASSSAR